MFLDHLTCDYDKEPATHASSVQSTFLFQIPMLYMYMYIPVILSMHMPSTWSLPIATVINKICHCLSNVSYPEVAQQ